jgi:hypothetical protein
MITFSVEIEQNSYADDLFIGTFEECVKYCKENDYTQDQNDARIAEIELDNRGCVVFWHDIITDF